jgi:two-component system, OmpR family, alkaline phosphatase synthesis response regulator PhoP
VTHHKILIVDDESAIRSSLDYYFKQAGYETILAHNGREALAKLSLNPDLFVLDIILPDVDGYQICRHIRRQPNYIPVLMLTAKDTLSEKVVGLDLGADVYLSKPYNPEELLAQVRAILRLAKRQKPLKLTCDRLELCMVENIFRLDGEEVPLTKTEFDLLFFLMQRQGRVLGRETLLQQVWGYEGEEINSRTVDTYIQRLRAKIEDNPKEPTLLLTVRGFGYRLVCPDK